MNLADGGRGDSRGQIFWLHARHFKRGMRQHIERIDAHILVSSHAIQHATWGDLDLDRPPFDGDFTTICLFQQITRCFGTAFLFFMLCGQRISP